MEGEMDRKLRHKMAIGCVGAITPVILSLLIFDAQNLANIDLPGMLGYALRVFALLFCACVVIFLNSDENKPAKIFQLGLAAPALLSGMINANMAVEKNKQVKAYAKAAQQTRDTE